MHTRELLIQRSIQLDLYTESRYNFPSNGPIVYILFNFTLQTIRYFVLYHITEKHNYIVETLTNLFNLPTFLSLERLIFNYLKLNDVNVAFSLLQ